VTTLRELFKVNTRLLVAPASAPGVAATISGISGIASSPVGSGPFFPGSGFRDGKLSVSHRAAIQGLDGGLRGFWRRHGDEGKSARASVFAINGHFDINYRPVRGEHLLELVLGQRVGHVANE
jgi:hypothetical protein